jgi:uncharacterized membrane protein YdjX (TVP38/TMEM64 family)
VTLVAALAGAVAALGVPKPGEAAAVVADLGSVAPAIAVAGCAVLVLGLFPRTVLSAAAGLVFGPWAGAGYVIAGATAGALVAFGVGRWLGRDFVAAQARIRRIDGWLTRGGVLGVLTVRVLPIAPFGLVSYGFGISGVRLRAYLAGTVLGMLPSTLVYANLGAAATEPGSAEFLVAAVVAILFAATTGSLAVWLGRRRARVASHNAGPASGS